MNNNYIFDYFDHKVKIGGVCCLVVVGMFQLGKKIPEIANFDDLFFIVALQNTHTQHYFIRKAHCVDFPLHEIYPRGCC